MISRGGVGGKVQVGRRRTAGNFRHEQELVLRILALEEWLAGANLGKDSPDEPDVDDLVFECFDGRKFMQRRQLNFPKDFMQLIALPC